MIDPGQMRYRVTLQEKTETNTEGMRRETWSNLSRSPQVWVHLDWQRGSRLVRNGSLEARRAAVMTGHWRGDLTGRHRALLDGEPLYFQEVPLRLDAPMAQMFEVLVTDTDSD